MPVLTEAQKVHAITRLACYDTPTMVAASLKEEFGVTVPRNQLGSYDPTKVNGARLAKQYKLLFETTRKRFLKDVAAIPVANKSVRMKLLNDAVFAAVEKRNPVLMANLLEQASKEVGEAFTNKAVVQHKGLNTNTITDADLVKGLARFGIRAKMPGAGQPGGNA